jgi:DegV family protein with EDD domain
VAGRLADGETAKTVAPSVLDFLDLIEREPADDVVIVTPAHEFTVINQHARAAAALADRPVHVVDTRTAAAAHGLVVAAALEAAHRGASADDVTAAARSAAARAELVAVVDGLATLRRSGVVPATALTESGARVLFGFRDGVVVPLGHTRRVVDALARVEATWLAAGGSRHVPALVFHRGLPARARRLQQRLSPAAEIVVFSDAMAVHTGHGCAGIAWLRAEPR